MRRLTRRNLLFLFGTTALAACAPAASPTAAPKPAPAAAAANPAEQPAGVPSADGRALLDGLVARAKQEGQLITTVLPSWNRATTVPQLVDGFKKRFNLDIEVVLTPNAAAAYIPKAMAETSAGTPPTYDVFVSSEVELAQLLGAKGVLPIENWQALLPAVNPDVASGRIAADVVSPGMLSGYGLVAGGGAVGGIVYNPRVISKDELPRTRADLANPKYKEKFAQPPWTTYWDIAPAVDPNFDENKWLELVRAAGQNTGAVVTSADGMQRVLLGQYGFVLGAEADYRRSLARDPNAPVGLAWWDDFNVVTVMVYSIRVGTSHPAAATLWALWMTTPEAEAIWQPNELGITIYDSRNFGPSEIDKQVAQLAEGVKRVSFLDNAQAEKTLAWYATPDGARYAAALAKAIRGE